MARDLWLECQMCTGWYRSWKGGRFEAQRGLDCELQAGCLLRSLPDFDPLTPCDQEDVQGSDNPSRKRLSDQETDSDT